MRLFLGGLKWETTEIDIEEALAQQGFPVTNVKVIYDRETNKAKGYGFADCEQGAACIDSCDGMELLGRQINIKEAQQRERPEGNRRAYGR